MPIRPIERAALGVIWAGIGLILLIPFAVSGVNAFFPLVVNDQAALFPPTIFPYLVGKGLLFRCIVEVVFVAWTVLAVLNPAYRPPRSLLLGLLALAIVLTLSLLGYILLGVQRLTVMADACTRTPAACFLVGLGTCFGLAVIGLMMSMLLPVSLPMVLLFPIVSAIGYCGLAFAIGRNLLPSTRPLLATVSGGILVAAVQLVPIVGWLVLVVLGNVALGAAIMRGFGISSDWLSAKAAGQFAR